MEAKSPYTLRFFPFSKHINRLGEREGWKGAWPLVFWFFFNSQMILMYNHFNIVYQLILLSFLGR